jgi:hypothetical protein
MMMGQEELRQGEPGCFDSGIVLFALDPVVDWSLKIRVFSTVVVQSLSRPRHYYGRALLLLQREAKQEYKT